MKKSLAVLVLSAFLAACETIGSGCGGNKKVGEVSFTEETLDFLPSSFPPQMIYQNAFNNQLIFTLRQNTEVSRETGNYIICRGDGGQVSTAYYTYLSKEVTYEVLSETDGGKFIYELQIGDTYSVYFSEPQPLVEGFSLKAEIDEFLPDYADLPSGLFVFTSDRGNPQVLEGIDEDYTFHSDTTILGKEFKDLYIADVDNNGIAYSSESGLVAFVKNDTTWVLKD